ncbi:hypothetical protein HYFRA_00001314 [Hymenoscyphus fraxineus]|uniref:Uncharacterized protein n=1 Tax=Hymenoscyphus fraxineus TaxID=746836 RepID=A0A9N9L6G8_9HELO|nr:hypothetical protein HYFRA_00001314 [Hymenoscyphus fraxineus]
MVVIGGPTSEIEVRLRKITGTGDNSDIYFDEYVSTSEREPQDNLRKERCIVPEDINYAIEVVFKKGFTIGKYDAEWCIYVRDLSSHTRLFIKWFCFSPQFEERSHKEDQIFEFSSVPQALVNGEVREDVELSFRRLVRGKFSVPDPGIGEDGVRSKRKRGLKVVVCRVSKKDSEPIPQKTLADRMARYKEQISGNVDTLNKPLTISEKEFCKEGISHETRHVQIIRNKYGHTDRICSLTGGTLSPAPLSEPLKLHATAKYQESHCYYFVLRTADYIEHNNFRKGPVPLEMYSWNVLNYQEKQRCFKILQDREQDLILQREISKAGPDVDEEDLRRKLFYKGGKFPTRLVPWNYHLPEAREAIFRTLQERVTYFEKGETPPEDLPQLETNRQSPPVSIKEEEMDTPNSHAPIIIDLDSDAEKQSVRATPSAPNTICIQAKAAQLVKSTLSNNGDTIQSPIDLDDYKPSTSLKQWMPRTIKGEPVDRSLFVSPPPILCNEEEYVKVKSEIRAAKNTVALKREYDESTTETLEKLKREEDELTVDLEYLEKIMEARQARREKRARIAALEEAQGT